MKTETTPVQDLARLKLQAEANWSYASVAESLGNESMATCRRLIALFYEREIETLLKANPELS